ncbi:cell division protein ZipA C-terminal FtsZ-binding domain-containing protein [Nitrosomonas aestuarii]|uniref:cell division protein ZipA C-terminal FtsZ-binding domain-containing protein n=1 Tax=Nitrosomonas aestuarii TaxID=52441 RepID=UPI000D31527C|nr:cell division protein ZipA C-terminal FtsZ-binding domain-containing protein [Nitrosomonas aestuarii]PTN12638.1 ZipA-like protein with FtsZ-binding domain [Nitrosomonas aestuarii]
MDILNMSDLQVSLIIIGIVIIIGVAIFNWIQHSRYRSKIESALDQKLDDALFEKNNNSKPHEPHERIEPQLNKDFFVKHAPKKDSLSARPLDVLTKENVADNYSDNQEYVIEPGIAESQPVLDEYNNLTNYIVIVSADAVIPSNQLNTLLQRKFDFNKPLVWFGQREKAGSWEEIAHTENTDYINLKGCLLLADRSGPISEIDLSIFRDTVQDFATQIGAEAKCPDIVPAHEQAIQLDKFCADVDVMIGINIISKDEGAFIGTKIRALAEASGFKLESDGLFKYRDENNQVLFTLTNYESEAFIPESMKALTTHGVTFLLDVPQVSNGEKVFDQMTHLAKIFSNTLGGIMVDDNRVPLSENGLSRSKQQLINIQNSMKENNIIAGSSNALKLFN